MSEPFANCNRRPHAGRIPRISDHCPDHRHRRAHV